MPPGSRTVEVVLLAHAVPAGPELDGDVGIEQHVGGAAQFLALVDPVGDVVDAAGGAGEVGDQAEIVRALAHRGHAEDDEIAETGLGVGDRLLHVAVAERLGVPLARRVTTSAVATVTWSMRARGDAARVEALRPVREQRRRPCRWP